MPSTTYKYVTTSTTHRTSSPVTAIRTSGSGNLQLGNITLNWFRVSKQKLDSLSEILNIVG